MTRLQYEASSGEENFEKLKNFILKNQKQQLLKFNTQEAQREGKTVEEVIIERERMFNQNKDLLLCDKVMILPDEISDDDSKESDLELE